MRHSSSTVRSANQDTYLVLDDLGRFGRVWRETAEADANRETLIRDLLDDQYSRPRRIVSFNTAEGWSGAGDRRPRVARRPEPFLQQDLAHTMKQTTGLC
jgi:hypothetical protein